MEKEYESINKLYKSLIKLMKTNNFSNITIKQVLLDSKVSKSTFYRHFLTLMDILEYKNILLLKQLANKYDGKLHYDRFIKTILTFIKENQEFYLTVYQNNLHPYLIISIDKFVGPKEYDDKVTSYSKSSFIYGVYGLINEWIKRGLKESPDEMQEMSNKLFKDFIK